LGEGVRAPRPLAPSPNFFIIKPAFDFFPRGGYNYLTNNKNSKNRAYQ
jgi:hypothetical protein